MKARGRSARNVAIVAALVVAAAVAGWFWAPFGQPAVPSSLAPATTGPTGQPVTQLAVGDCFVEYDSAWSGSFTTTPCEEPHAAELIGIVPVETVLPGASSSDEAAPDATDAGWPGEEALRSHAMLACQSPDVLDLNAAENIPDLLVEARWPVSAAEWDGGVRDYFCFASSPMTDLRGSLRP